MCRSTGGISPDASSGPTAQDLRLQANPDIGDPFADRCRISCHGNSAPVIMTLKRDPDCKLINKTENWSQCIERIGANQDKIAFKALFEHFSPFLKAFLIKSGGVSPENAEELVQETMIKVWRKAPTYSSTQAAASTWLYTIARNTRIDWLRKQNRQNTDLVRAEDLYDEQDNPTPMSSLAQIRTRKLIQEQLGTLPAEQSEVLQLMYFQGQSGQQVATSLSLPLGTVKSRIRLAMNKMKLGLASRIDPGDIEGISP